MPGKFGVPAIIRLVVTNSLLNSTCIVWAFFPPWSRLSFNAHETGYSTELPVTPLERAHFSLLAPESFQFRAASEILLYKVLYKGSAFHYNIEPN